MVAYSFKPRFVEPILAGTKAQTIRVQRQGRGRHAQPGQTMHLFTGMRTRNCLRIADVTCIEIADISIQFGDKPWISVAGYGLTEPGNLEWFARADGFATFADMQAFWHKEHPASADEGFVGVMLRWSPLQPKD